MVHDSSSDPTRSYDHKMLIPFLSPRVLPDLLSIFKCSPFSFRFPHAQHFICCSVQIVGQENFVFNFLIPELEILLLGTALNALSNRIVPKNVLKNFTRAITHQANLSQFCKCIKHDPLQHKHHWMITVIAIEPKLWFQEHVLTQWYIKEPIWTGSFMKPPRVS